jgi:hypothetical protein
VSSTARRIRDDRRIGSCVVSHAVRAWRGRAGAPRAPPDAAGRLRSGHHPPLRERQFQRDDLRGADVQLDRRPSIAAAPRGGSRRGAPGTPRAGAGSSSRRPRTAPAPGSRRGRSCPPRSAGREGGEGQGRGERRATRRPPWAVAPAAASVGRSGQVGARVARPATKARGGRVKRSAARWRRGRVEVAVEGAEGQLEAVARRGTGPRASPRRARRPAAGRGGRRARASRRAQQRDGQVDAASVGTGLDLGQAAHQQRQAASPSLTALKRRW